MEIKDLYKLYLAHPKITTDSRKDVSGSLFFALTGESFNGNTFAETAIQKGAAFAIIDDEKYARGEKYIPVKDVLLTLQQLALFHRKQLRIPLLAITGSNGKTTTKELIARVLQNKFNTEYTRGNLNNHIGVPLSILAIRKNTEFAVIEMGANHGGEIDNLCRIALPRFGIITNIGKAHLEGFGNFEGVVKAKSELYKHILQNHGSLFVNNDNPLLDQLSKEIPRITYGAMPGADCQARIHKTNPYLVIHWDSDRGIKTISTQLYGAYNFENVMAAICVGAYFGVDQDDIINAVASYNPDNQRSEIIETGDNQIIMDAYNANPTSMELALQEFFHYPGRNKSLILGDMLELGSFALEEHQNLLELLEKNKCMNVYLVGPIFFKLNKNKNFKSFLGVDSLSSHFEQYPLKNHTILIKGSRGIKLEKIIPSL